MDWSLECFVTNAGDYVDGQIKEGIRILLMGAVAYYYGPIGGFFGFALKWVKIPINIASKVGQVYASVKKRSIDLMNLITNNKQSKEIVDHSCPQKFSENSNHDLGLFNFLIRDSIRNMTETNEEIESLICEIAKGELAGCENVTGDKRKLNQLILWIVENKNKKT